MRLLIIIVFLVLTAIMPLWSQTGHSATATTSFNCSAEATSCLNTVRDLAAQTITVSASATGVVTPYSVARYAAANTSFTFNCSTGSCLNTVRNLSTQTITFSESVAASSAHYTSLSSSVTFNLSATGIVIKHNSAGASDSVLFDASASTIKHTLTSSSTSVSFSGLATGVVNSTPGTPHTAGASSSFTCIATAAPCLNTVRQLNTETVVFNASAATISQHFVSDSVLISFNPSAVGVINPGSGTPYVAAAPSSFTCSGTVSACLNTVRQLPQQSVSFNTSATALVNHSYTAQASAGITFLSSSTTCNSYDLPLQAITFSATAIAVRNGSQLLTANANASFQVIATPIIQRFLHTNVGVSLLFTPDVSNITSHRVQASSNIQFTSLANWSIITKKATISESFVFTSSATTLMNKHASVNVSFSFSNVVTAGLPGVNFGTVLSGFSVDANVTGIVRSSFRRRVVIVITQ